MQGRQEQLPQVGIGFRPEIHDETVQHLDYFDVLEVIVDHYISAGPRVRELVLEASRQKAVVGHGVGLSLGTATSPDPYYLDQCAEALEVIHAPSHSEHLAFTKVPGHDLAELLPLPRTESVAEIVVENIRAVRRHITLPFAVENVTYYFEYPQSEMSELDFITLVCRESGASLLLDVENLYINSRNHGFNPYHFVDQLPSNIVQGIHVAGGVTHGDLMIDSHSAAVPSEVLSLLRYVLQHQSPDTVILERDQDLTPFEPILTDVQRIRKVVDGLGGEQSYAQKGASPTAD